MLSEGKRLAHYSYLSVAYLLVKVIVILMILTVICTLYTLCFKELLNL